MTYATPAAAAPAVSNEEILAVLAPLRSLEGPLLPMLHALQAAFGYVPEAAHSVLTSALGITRAELHGVLSFYHDFRDMPAGRHVLKICRAEACQAMGGAETAEELLRRLGLEWHATTQGGGVTIEPVYCLGLCACAPAAMLDEQPLARVDADGLQRLIEECR